MAISFDFTIEVCLSMKFVSFIALPVEFMTRLHGVTVNINEQDKGCDAEKL